MLSINAQGSLNWLNAYTGAGALGSALSIVAAPDGGAYLGGFTNPTGMSGSYDVLLARCDQAGTILWSQTAGGVKDDTAGEICLSPSGDLFVTGNVTGAATFGNTTLPGNGNGAFVARYSPTGSLNWVQRLGAGTGTSGSSSGTSLTVDANNGLYVAGGFSGTLGFGSQTLTNPSTSGNIYVCKLDQTSGAVQWAQAADAYGSSNEHVAFSNGLLLLAGDFYGYPNSNTLRFGSTVSFTTATSVGIGGNDIFLASFSPAGLPLRGQMSRSNNAASRTFLGGLCVDAAGNILLTGEVLGNVTYGFQTRVTSSPALVLAKLKSSALSLATAGPAQAVHLAVYPQPAHDYALLQLPASGVPEGGHGPVAVELLDALGQIAARYTISPSNSTLSLPLAEISAGIYVVRVGLAGVPPVRLVVE